LPEQPTLENRTFVNQMRLICDSNTNTVCT